MRQPDYTPPKFYERLFAWFCKPEYYEELQGDLEEAFLRDTKKHGLKIAHKNYRQEVLHMIRPIVIRPLALSSFFQNTPDMLQNYLKTTWRNLKRHRLFSAINILGLAASMSIGLLLIAMYADLVKFDEFHVKKNRVFRIISTTHESGRSPDPRATCPPPLVAELEENYDGIEEIVRIRRNFWAEAKANNKELRLRGYYADAGFFNVFYFPMIEGDLETALQEPFSIVMTKTAAKRFFDDKNPIGQVIEMGDLGNFQVTALIEDVPQSSHLQFEILGAYSTVPILEKQEKIQTTTSEWNTFFLDYAYLLLPPDFRSNAIHLALNEIGKTAYKKKNEFFATFELQALTKIVPGRDLSSQIGPKMNPLQIMIPWVFVILILLSASFNYTNLSIARSLKRAREIGVRKVTGASRWQIFSQFMTEAIVYAIIALLFACLLFVWVRPDFLMLVPRASEMLQLQLTPIIVLGFLGFAILVGILAGFFPSMILSRMKPVAILNSLNNLRLFRRLNIRKGLMVFQFVLSLFFIIAISTIYHQYRFAIHHDMGFSQENILNVQLQNVDHQILRDEMAKIPEVKNISFSSVIPGGGGAAATYTRLDGQLDSLITFYMHVDHNYIENHNIPLIAGQYFPKENNLQNESFVIVNEEFVKRFHLGNPEEALYQSIWYGEETAQIIGVVEDFHYTHIEEPIKGFFFRNDPQHSHFANLKISSTNMPATLGKLANVWESLGKGTKLEATFLDEDIAGFYQFLVDQMKVFGFVAFIAIAIACMGLLGMTVYVTETRIKEIGVRKVLGAKVWQIVVLISKNFVLLLALAALIATPPTYLLFDQVILNNFAYRINLGFTEIAPGITLLLLLGISLIASQTIRAARINPAEHLRSE